MPLPVNMTAGCMANETTVNMTAGCIANDTTVNMTAGCIANDTTVNITFDVALRMCSDPERARVTPGIAIERLACVKRGREVFLLTLAQTRPG